MSSRKIHEQLGCDMSPWKDYKRTVRCPLVNDESCDISVRRDNKEVIFQSNMITKLSLLKYHGKANILI